MAITGGCLCGRVRYTVTGDLRVAGVCHCRTCQKNTGSAFTPFMVYPAETVRVEGDLKTFENVGGSGHAVQRRFCLECGSSVLASVDHGTKTVIFAGTLDNPAVFKPTAEIFCSSAQPWVFDDAKQRQKFEQA